MTPQEILVRFVANNDIRFYLRNPFTIAGSEFVYASNGHVIVRVPFSGGIEAEQTDRVPNAHEMFAKNKRSNFIEEFPSMPEAYNCQDCNGSGICHECGDCDGRGEFFYGHNVYRCNECHGSGQSGSGGKEVVCCNCDGSGHAQQPVAVYGGIHAARSHLAKLADLPGIKIAVGMTEYDPIYFVFDGGEGLLAPIGAGS